MLPLAHAVVVVVQPMLVDHGHRKLTARPHHASGVPGALVVVASAKSASLPA